jgi:hypothetical protein
MVDYDNPADAQETAQAAVNGAAPPPEIPAAEKALVKRWLRTIKGDAAHWKDVFARMEKCEELAAEGADEQYLKSDQYVVPIITRHINQSVAQLYAKNPRAAAARRKRLMYQLWDGKPESIQSAMQAVAPPVDAGSGLPYPPDPVTGGILDIRTGQPWQPDPNAVALLEEVQAVAAQNAMLDKLATTLELTWDYFTSEQGAGFKEQMKLLVRMAKTCGVGYVKLAFQRELQPRPELAAGIDDATTQLSALAQLQEKASRPPGDGGMEADSADSAQKGFLERQLSETESVIAREGPVFDFPHPTEIIPSKKLRHLKTWTGAPHLTRVFHKTPDEIQALYGVDIRGRYTEYAKSEGGETKEEGYACVYEVEHKEAGQTFAVCVGYPGFLRQPGPPDTRLERFYTYFALVFNEPASKRKPFPPSDVWLLRHTQAAYNLSREGLREHRRANRPKYFTKKGKLSREDKNKLANAEAHSVIELQGLQQGEDVKTAIQRPDLAPIDPAMYDTRGYFEDMLRTVGAQEANLGGTSSATATESSIAEQSRSASMADNVDDLDDMLTALAKAFGQLCLLELSKDTVTQIAGPGAVWPDAAMSREDIARDLLLEIKAGSNGRPNRAADIANMERAWPILSNLPGMNPQPVAKKIAHLLDIELEDLYVEGLPSFTAMNALMGKPAPMGAEPTMQGPAGAANAPQPPGMNAGGQPAYPALAPPIPA